MKTTRNIAKSTRILLRFLVSPDFSRVKAFYSQVVVIRALSSHDRFEFPKYRTNVVKEDVYTKTAPASCRFISITPHICERFLLPKLECLIGSFHQCEEPYLHIGVHDSQSAADTSLALIILAP